jgi:hypothetical protein
MVIAAWLLSVKHTLLVLSKLEDKQNNFRSLEKYLLSAQNRNNRTSDRHVYIANIWRSDYNKVNIADFEEATINAGLIQLVKQINSREEIEKSNLGRLYVWNN